MVLITMSQAATRANVSLDTIRRRIKDGTLNEYRQGVRPRVDTVELDRFFSPHSRIEAAPGICRVIAVANQKGGVGKTSTCANLATALSAGGARVLAVDCDPQGNLTQAFGPDPDSLDMSLYNVLIERQPLEKALLNPVLGLPGLSLVGANLELAAADLQLGNAVARESRLRQVLEPHLAFYDYVFIDCPPALGLLTLNALTAATEVIVPVEMGVFSLRGVSKLMDTISEVRSINPGLRRIRALSNRSDNTNLSLDVQAELKRSFGDDLFKTVIRRSVKVGEAQAAHLPITVYRPKDPAAKDYRDLAEEVKNAA